MDSQGAAVIRRLSTVIAVLLLAAAVPPAHAGPFGDDLAKCLVRSTTSEDKTSLVQWMFAVMGLHPQVKQFTMVSPEKRNELNKHMADLMVALLVDRCGKESREAIKNEGMVTIQSSFSLLGQVAAQELFTNPDVAAGLEQFSKSIDENRLKSLTEDAK
jgi:hypothetical protein